MSSYLSMMETRLPPGFRFHPRDEELICDYLAKKVFGENNGNGSCSVYGCPTMIDVDLNKCEPWDLPETARVGSKEWYFFSLRDRKYATGQRTNRATMSGYWKATGKDRHVTRTGVLVGMRKTLVFYQGRAPKGRKTDWVMHEFRLESSGDESKLNSIKEDWVLCRVFNKSRGNSSSSFKPNMETTSSYEDMISSTSSHSLPPLMDQTYITFGGQTSQSFEGYDEQVPCFSNPTFQISSSLSGPPMAGPSPAGAVHRSMSPMKSADPDHLGSGLKQLDCEKKVIRAVLNHLTKLEGDPNLSLGEGSIDRYLCENNGFSPMW